MRKIETEEVVERRMGGVMSNRTISKSNKRKIRVRKKYRREKGIRERLFVSKPHS